MGEKVYGYHAIEEAIKKAGMGSTLYIARNSGDRVKALEQDAKATTAKRTNTYFLKKIDAFIIFVVNGLAKDFLLSQSYFLLRNH